MLSFEVCGCRINKPGREYHGELLGIKLRESSHYSLLAIPFLHQNTVCKKECY